jgi:transcriptional regulator with PAS, ATPase and Fis domain
VGTLDHPTESLVTSADRGAKPVRARLRTVAPRGVRWALELASAPVTLGRAPEDGTPSLVHGTVSRLHARIFWDSEQRTHVAEDLQSRHGTEVDGESAIGPVAMRDGAVVRLGGVFLAYERVPDDAADPVEVSKEQLPGESYAMVRLRAQVARAAGDPSPVLVTGATGTGKEWVANELHRLSGRKGPIIAVNCAALAPQLVESQLFGHVRGAFTGATESSDGLFRAANNGTLFLDEVGELPLELQPKLLRVLQDGMVQPVGGTKATQVDVRVVAATNRDIAAMVDSSRFRRDLHARLAKWTIEMPSLGARRGDIPMWIDRLWTMWCAERHVKRALPDLTSAATAVLLGHAWHDNLRGIDRLVHELASRKGDAPVDRADLPAWAREEAQTERRPVITPPAGVPALKPVPPPIKPPVPTREEFEGAWKDLGGNVRALARKYGRDRRQIYRWAEAYGLRSAQQGDDSDDE